MVLSWQWPAAVDKLGILDIPCPPLPDHLKVWMFKIDDLVHMKLPPNHYLCIQYAWALQFHATITTNATICRPASCLDAFIMAMCLFYKITTAMWQPHMPTPPFVKPHMELTPHHQATHYFDGLRDMREEAIWFESGQKGDHIYDPIPQYKKDEKFMNFSRGCGQRTSTQTVGIATTTATHETVGEQFIDAEMTPSESAATATMTMPPLEDAEPLKEAVAPSSDAYNPAGNKYTRPNSPKTEDYDSKIEPNPSSQDTVISSPSQAEDQVKTVDNNPPTPDILPGTADVVIAQLDEEQQEAEKQPDQPILVAATKTVEVKAKEAMVDPLQVLPASVPASLGSTTVTKEED